MFGQSRDAPRSLLPPVSAFSSKHTKTRVSHHPRPHTAPTPPHRPPPRLSSLHEFRDSPIPDPLLLQPFHNDFYTTELTQHGRIPLTPVCQDETFIDHTAHKRDFTAGGHHLDIGACAGRVRWSRFGGCKSEKIRGGGVKWGIADGEIDAERYELRKGL